MSKTSNTVKDRWNNKAYDDIRIRVPKGQKQAVEAFAREQGESVNGMVNTLIRAKMGLSEEEWKKPSPEE